MNLLFSNETFFKKLITFIFVLLLIWWVVLFFVFQHTFSYANLVWAASYQIIAILGAILGLIISKHWGGFRSTLGRSILFFSIGLLLQAFGQSMFSFYNLILKIDIPYPSISDIGFFGSIIFYIYGAILLGRAFSANTSLKNFLNKILVILIPVILLSVSYYFFLRNYEFYLNNPLKIFLDFGYPLGQVMYVSITISVYILSRKFLGGVLKKSILFILIALIIQYVADYNFLYQALKQTWINGGYGDVVYMLAYTVLAIGLIDVGSTFNKIKSDRLSETLNTGGLNVGVVGTIPILNQIILAIIKRQERVAGQIAWEEAKEIPGFTVIDQQQEEISVSGNSVQGSRKVIDDLVSRYKHIFGDLAIQVSKEAARHLLAELSKDEVPDSLK